MSEEDVKRQQSKRTNINYIIDYKSKGRDQNKNPSALCVYILPLVLDF